MSSTYKILRTMFIIKNDELPNNIKRIFSRSNIPIDEDYLKQIKTLQDLYSEIQSVYDDKELLRFRKIVKTNAIKNNPVSLNKFKVVRDFHFIFVNLVNKDNIISGHTIVYPNERSQVIANFLQWDRLSSSLVIKYDYYFTENLIKKMPTYINDPMRISSQGNFVFITSGNELMIMNFKTNERRLFIFPDQDTVIRPHHNILVYGNNNFAIGRTVISEGNPITTIALINFYNDEEKYYKFTNNIRIRNIQLLTDKSSSLVITTMQRVYILNTESLTIQEYNFNQHVSSIQTFQNGSHLELIIGGLRTVSFWNYNTNESIYRMSFPGETITNIQFLDNKKIIAISNDYIRLIDFRTKLILKEVDIRLLDPLSDDERKTEGWIKKMIITEKDIIVHTRRRIFLFDYDLILKLRSEIHSDIILLDMVPDGNILSINRSSLKVWNIENLNIILETTQIKSFGNILVNGKIIRLEDDDLMIFG